MVSDEQIQKELDVYNALIPEPGELSATLFIELTGEDAPAGLAAPAGGDRALRDPAAAAGSSSGDRRGVDGFPEGESCGPSPRPPTRRPSPGPRSPPRCTTSDSPSTPAQVERFAAGPVTLAVDHPEYHAESVLSDEVRAELLTDLRS